LFPEFTRTGRDIDQTPLPSVEIKNEWSHTSTPQYAFTTRIRTALPFIKLNHILTLIMSDHIILNFKLPHNGAHVREAARPPFSQYSAYPGTQMDARCCSLPLSGSEPQILMILSHPHCQSRR